MKSMIVSFIIFSSLVVQAQEADCEDKTIAEMRPVMEVAAAAQEETTCPNPKKLRGMCMLIDGQDKDPNPQGHFVYKYQRKILEAACVDVNKDNEEVIAQKVSKVWKDNENTLICNNTKFDVGNGNIIKFAVNLKFDSFITDMTYWKVNLNKVDETDSRTVLDYIRDQIERNKGLVSEPVLRGYYNQLKKAGAKHKSDI